MRKRQMSRAEFEKRLDSIRVQLRAEVPPFKETSPEALGERKRRAARDVLDFGRTYLPHYFTHGAALWHGDFASALSGLSHQILACHGHRDGAKSVIASLAFVLQRHLADDGDHFIIVASETETIASDFVAFIKLELEENPRIRADYGDMAGHPWGDKNFVSANGRRILARGIGQQVRGLRHRQHRPSLVVCDDLESEESALNPKRVRKLYSWFFRTLIPAVGEGWRVVVVGTLLAKGCFLDKLMESADDGKPVVTRIYKAVTKGAGGREQSTWPARRPMRFWRAVKEAVGSLIWGAEYQGEPSDEEATIREEWLSENYWQDGDLDGVEMEAVAEGYDPSTGTTTDGSYGAIAKVARCPRGHFWVMDAWIKRRSVKRQVQALVDIYVDGLRPAKVTAESISFAALVMNELAREERKRGVRLPVVEIKHQGNKDVRLASLGPLAERGLLHLNPDQGDQALLVEQLIHLDNANVETDGPDALEMTVRALEGLVKPAASGRSPTREERRPGRRGRLFGDGAGSLYDPEPEEEPQEAEKEEVPA